MDIESFLNPYGGSGQDKNINAGLLGLAGMAMDSSLMDKYYFKPLRSDYGRIFSQQRKEYVAGITSFHKELGATPEYVSRIAKKSNMAYFAENKSARRSFFSSFDKKALSSKRFIKAAGWAFIASQLMDLGEGLFTPGINKVAARRDAQMFMDESPLDSSRTATARMRALQAISDSSLQIRHVLGNEAAILASR